MVLKTVQTGNQGSTSSGTVREVDTGTGLTGGPITTTGTIALANTAVTPQTYGDGSHVSQITVDQQGRITAAANVSITAQGTVTNIATGTGLTGGPIIGTGTISIANTAVTAGTYGNATAVAQVTLNAQGQATGASNVVIASVTLGNTALAPGATVTTVGNLTLTNATLSISASTSNTANGVSSMMVAPTVYFILSVNGTSYKIPAYTT